MDWIILGVIVLWLIGLSISLWAVHSRIDKLHTRLMRFIDEFRYHERENIPASKVMLDVLTGTSPYTFSSCHSLDAVINALVKHFGFKVDSIPSSPRRIEFTKICKKAEKK